MPTRANTGSFRRRTGATRSIAAPDPSQVTIPPLPPSRDWTPEAVRWWDTVHRSAIASEWEPDDLAVVERALRLVDDEATLAGIGNLSEDRKTLAVYGHWIKKDTSTSAAAVPDFTDVVALRRAGFAAEL